MAGTASKAPNQTEGKASKAPNQTEAKAAAKAPTVAELAKQIAQLSATQEAQAKENAELKASNEKLAKSLEDVSKVIPTKKVAGRPVPKASAYKEVEVSVSVKGGKTKKVVFEISEAYRKENKIFNPVKNEFTTIDALVENAQNGDASIIKAIIATQEETKTPYNCCGIKPKQ